MRLGPGWKMNKSGITEEGNEWWAEMDGDIRINTSGFFSLSISRKEIKEMLKASDNWWGEYIADRCPHE